MDFVIILLYYQFLKQLDLFVEDIHKINDHATNSVIIYSCLIYFFQDYMNQNIKIYESFQMKRVSRGYYYFDDNGSSNEGKNSSAQSLILLNFFSNSNILASFTSKNWRNSGNLVHILQTCYLFEAADSYII